jgi:predicted DCC family thiol-disulfide oxidoreductase YuxK
MTDGPAPSPSPEGAHLVLYDGVCGLCSALVQFLLRHDQRRVFRFASLQSATGRALVAKSGANPLELTSMYVIADYLAAAPRTFTRSDAALFIASELQWPWRVFTLIRIVPAAVRNRLYDAVAQTRYRVFGRYEQCQLPRPEFRGRFVE